MVKKRDEDRLSAEIRLRLRPEDKELIQEAARQESRRGEVSDVAREVLVAWANAVLRRKVTAKSR
jgi:uncharacterized protein (DUF1778 family)